MRTIHPFARIGLACLLLFFAAGCTNRPVDHRAPMDVTIVASWSGDFPVDQLRRLPEGQRRSRVGYLADPEIFADVWQVLMPGEPIPQVDFSRNMVVFSRNVTYFNRSRIIKVTLIGGVAEVLAMETMSAMPIEDVLVLALAVVPRAGIQFIQSGEEKIPVGIP